MEEGIRKSKHGERLREESEKKAGREAEKSPTQPTTDYETLVHELQVHQIELEMQNEELRLAQLTIERSRARYFDLFDVAPIGYFTLNDKGLIVEANLEGANILGVPRNNLAGQRLSRFIAPAFQDAFYLHRRDALNTNTRQTCELKLLKANSDSLWARLVSIIVDDNEDNCRLLLIAVSDITDRKKAMEQLEQAKIHAEAANVAKSQFLALMSHEIRTPMSVILSFADVMSMGDLTDEQRDHIDLVQKAGKSLMRIIEDIRDFSKIEAGKLTLNPAEHELSNLLDSVESMMRLSAAEENLKFAVIRGDGLPSTIRTDYDRVHQCLLNLVGNAIKFTDKGHVYLKVSMQNKSAMSYLRFDVEDTGIGIPSDKLDRIFVPFAQVDVSQTRRHSGTGLGLSITRQLAQLLGGGITVSSELGKGSVFSMVIPTGTKAVQADEKPCKSEKQKVTRFSGSVLLVEDHAAIRTLLATLLERLGLVVTPAKDAAEAIDVALRQSFDVIFMDIQMPGMDGYTAIARLREEGITTPIVALTAHAMDSDRDVCIRAGCDDYMPKPVERKELERILGKYASGVKKA